MEQERVPLEQRVAKIEGILEQLCARMNHLETRMSRLESELRSNFRWTVGIMLAVLIPMWVSIILAIVFT